MDKYRVVMAGALLAAGLSSAGISTGETLATYQMLTPETALELARGIRNPGSILVEQFAREGLEVRELLIGQERPTAGSVRILGIDPLFNGCHPLP